MTTPTIRQDEDDAPGMDYLDTAEFICPGCKNSECSVHVASMHLITSPSGHKWPMFSCWTACGYGFEMRLDSGIGPLLMVAFNRHRRRDVTADPATFTFIDPPPAWQYTKRVAS